MTTSLSTFNDQRFEQWELTVRDNDVNSNVTTLNFICINKEKYSDIIFIKFLHNDDGKLIRLVTDANGHPISRNFQQYLCIHHCMSISGLDYHNIYVCFEALNHKRKIIALQNKQCILFRLDLTKPKLSREELQYIDFMWVINNKEGPPSNSSKTTYNNIFIHRTWINTGYGAILPKDILDIIQHKIL